MFGQWSFRWLTAERFGLSMNREYNYDTLHYSSVGGSVTYLGIAPYFIVSQVFARVYY